MNKSPSPGNKNGSGNVLYVKCASLPLKMPVTLSLNRLESEILPLLPPNPLFSDCNKITEMTATDGRFNIFRFRRTKQPECLFSDNLHSKYRYVFAQNIHISKYCANTLLQIQCKYNNVCAKQYHCCTYSANIVMYLHRTGEIYVTGYHAGES